MQNIKDFLSSHPYAETTKRTYSLILRRLLAESQDPASITAPELLNFLNVT